MADKTLRAYNLGQVGVDVDTDDVHVATGAFRSAQNIHRSASMKQSGGIVSRLGLAKLNATAMGAVSVLGGIAIPAFEAGDGAASLLIGFGD